MTDEQVNLTVKACVVEGIDNETPADYIIVSFRNVNFVYYPLYKLDEDRPTNGLLRYLSGCCQRTTYHLGFNQMCYGCHTSFAVPNIPMDSVPLLHTAPEDEEYLRDKLAEYFRFHWNEDFDSILAAGELLRVMRDYQETLERVLGVLESSRAQKVAPIST